MIWEKEEPMCLTLEPTRMIIIVSAFRRGEIDVETFFRRSHCVDNFSNGDDVRRTVEV